MGRPSEFSLEVADAICERIAEGESLRAICAAEEMPNKATVFRWLANNKAFSDQYARARESQADLMADEILEIADETERDTILTDSGEKPNAEWISRSRLRVDARKWLASKMAPKKYGDKVTAEHVGPNGGPVQFERVVREIVDPQAPDTPGV